MSPAMAGAFFTTEPPGKPPWFVSLSGMIAVLPSRMLRLPACLLFPRLVCGQRFFLSADYSRGFGGKYGIDKDKVDKSAVGFEYQGKTEKHESQKGGLSLAPSPAGSS